MAFLSRIGKWSLQRKSFNIQDKTKVSKKAVPQHQLILSSRLDVLCRRPISEASCLYWATSSTGRQDQISDNSQERLLIFIFGFYYNHQILQPSLFTISPLNFEVERYWWNNSLWLYISPLNIIIVLYFVEITKHTFLLFCSRNLSLMSCALFLWHFIHIHRFGPDQYRVYGECCKNECQSLLGLLPQCSSHLRESKII